MDDGLGGEHQAVQRTAARGDGALEQRPRRASGCQQREQNAEPGGRAAAARAVAAVALAALALGACGAVRGGDAPSRSAAGATADAASNTTTFLVKETRLRNGLIDVRLEIPLLPEGRKPAIIGALGDPRALRASGFVVVTYTVHAKPHPDAPPASDGAANAVGKWVLASPSAGVLGRTYLRGIAANADEYVPAIIDWLETVPEVDAGRIGIAGASTNGFVALQAVAADRRIGAAAVVAACGDYHRFLRDSSMGMGGAPLRLEPGYDQWVTDQEIIHRPRRLVHAALLLVALDGDELIPIACADRTAEALTRAYAAAGVPDRFRYARVVGAGHGVTPRDATEVRAWFERWLLPSPRP